MSVIDNVKVALHNQITYSMWDSIFRFPKFFKREKDYTKQATDILDVFGLTEYAEYSASNLPYGQQRKLEIAREIGRASCRERV